MSKSSKRTPRVSRAGQSDAIAATPDPSLNLIPPIVFPEVPRITSISPGQITPGILTPITATGSGLPVSFAYSLRTPIDGVPVTGVNFQFPTACPGSLEGRCVIVPVQVSPGLTAGVYQFRVETAGGSTFQPLQVFGQTLAPRIDSISPSLINLGPGIQNYTIALNGANLPVNSSDYTVISATAGAIQATLTLFGGTLAILSLTIDANRIPQGLTDFSVCARNFVGQVFCRLLQIQNFTKSKDKEKEKEKDKEKEKKSDRSHVVL